MAVQGTVGMATVAWVLVSVLALPTIAGVCVCVCLSEFLCGVIGDENDGGSLTHVTF